MKTGRGGMAYLMFGKRFLRRIFIHGEKIAVDEDIWQNSDLIDKYGTLALLEEQDLNKVMRLDSIICIGFDDMLINIEPLSKLNQLKHLDLEHNHLKDIDDLFSLNKLTELYLLSNQIQDISPLANLTKLTKLDL